MSEEVEVNNDIVVEKKEEKKGKKEKKSKTSEAAPAPAPAPSAATSAASSPKESPEPEISTFAESDDPETFNMHLKMPEGETYVLNAKNWVCTESGTWIGIWDPETKTIDRTAPEPE